MVQPFVSTAVDTSQHTVLKMHRIGPPTCCPFPCGHRDCERRKREAVVPCVVCEARVQPGEYYRVLCRVDGEVVTQVHVACERRKFDR